MPFVVIYLFNWTVYIIILATLCCKNYRKDAEFRKNPVKLKQQLIAAVTLSVLFGLGWGIGLLATEGVRVAALRDFFSAVFIICTAFQGVMVFCLQTLRSKPIQSTWARWFNMVTGKEISVLTSSANISQIWRNRRSHQHSNFDSSAVQMDSCTVQSNEYEITTLQRNVKNVSFPAGLTVTTIDEQDEPDENEAVPCDENNYFAIEFNPSKENTAEFKETRIGGDFEMKATPKDKTMKYTDSGCSI